MPEYRVFFEDRAPTNVQADHFEIEDGALVFYESDDNNDVTIGKKSDESFTAHNSWNRVKRHSK